MRQKEVLDMELNMEINNIKQSVNKGEVLSEVRRRVG